MCVNCARLGLYGMHIGTSEVSLQVVWDVRTSKKGIWMSHVFQEIICFEHRQKSDRHASAVAQEHRMQ